MAKSMKKAKSTTTCKAALAQRINFQYQPMQYKKAVASLKLRPFKANHRQAVEHVSIEALLALMVESGFEGQRSHEERAPKTKALHGELCGNKLDFAAIRFKDPITGEVKIQLADGYTRLTCLTLGLAWIAEDANTILTVNDCLTEEQKHERYNEYNALGAAKVGKDRVKEGIRIATNDVFALKSEFMQKAQIVSAMNALNPGRWKVETQKSRMVAECVPAMLFLDNLHLRVNKNRGCAPLLTVMLLAAKNTQGDLRSYVARYAIAMQEACFTQMPNASVSDIALKTCYDNWTNYLNRLERKPTGQKAVDAALSSLMGDFARYFNACLVEAGKRRNQVQISGRRIADILAEIKEVSEKLAA